jgi:hypothetical protein
MESPRNCCRGIFVGSMTVCGLGVDLGVGVVFWGLVGPFACIRGLTINY